MNQIDKNARDINDGLFPHNGDCEHQLAYLLKYAILAPSHYNAQPWNFRLNHRSVDVFFDRSRVSRFVDPDAREAIISCGAAIRMFEIAAHYFGLNIDVTLNKEPHSEHIAELSISGAYDHCEEDEALFHAIKYRQSNRNWFNDADIPEHVIEQITQAAWELKVQLVINQERQTNQAFAKLTQNAVQQQFDRPWFRLEFASWQRSSLSFKNDGMTGFGLFRPALPYPLARPLFRWFGWGEMVARYNYDKCLMGSPLLAVISTEVDDKKHWVNTGRALSSVLLLLATHQLSASFMNQAIQEPESRKQLPRLFESQDKPQVVLRIG